MQPAGGTSPAPVIVRPNPPVEIPAVIEVENPLPVRERVIVVKPSTGRRRKSNAEKPPAIRGYKWAVNGAGFDCRKYAEINGETVEAFVAYLGKRKLAEMRAESSDAAHLRQLVKEWIQEKESTKGKSLTRVSTPKQNQNRRDKSDNF